MKRISALVLLCASVLPVSAIAQALELKPAKTLSYTEIGASQVHESVSNQPNAWTESQ